MRRKYGDHARSTVVMKVFRRLCEHENVPSSNAAYLSDYFLYAPQEVMSHADLTPDGRGFMYRWTIDKRTFLDPETFQVYVADFVCAFLEQVIFHFLGEEHVMTRCWNQRGRQLLRKECEQYARDLSLAIRQLLEPEADALRRGWQRTTTLYERIREFTDDATQDVVKQYERQGILYAGADFPYPDPWDLAA